jgi:ankyrin repeat protein
MRGKIETVSLFIERGADVNIENNKGETLLSQAVKFKQIEIATCSKNRARKNDRFCHFLHSHLSIALITLNAID